MYIIYYLFILFLFYLLLILGHSIVKNVPLSVSRRAVNAVIASLIKEAFQQPEPPAYRADNLLGNKLVAALAPYNELPEDATFRGHYYMNNIPYVLINFIPKGVNNLDVIKAVLESTFAAHLYACGISDFRLLVDVERASGVYYKIFLFYAVSQSEIARLCNIENTRRYAANQTAQRAAQPLVDKELECDINDSNANRL